MAEVIGVVAAAGQLATACVGLLDLTKKIKGGSSTLRDYQRQLQELRSISEAISENPLLQTPEIGDHTCSLLTLVNENNLKPLIDRGRFLRTWAFIWRDTELSSFFNTLERRKSSLSLVIHNLQAQALHQIQSDIQVMANSRRSSDESDNDESQQIAHRVTTSNPSSSNIANPVSWNIHGHMNVSAPQGFPNLPVHSQWGYHAPDTPGIGASANIPPPTNDSPVLPAGYGRRSGNAPDIFPTQPITPRMTYEQVEDAMRMQAKVQETNPDADIYIDCISGHGGTQLNAPVVRGGSEADDIANSIWNGPGHVHLACDTHGSGKQLNGTYARYNGPTDVAGPSARKNFAYHCNTVPLQLDDGTIVGGKQVNAPVFRPYKDGEPDDDESFPF